ncbi:hypothetical protein POWCR01_000019000 [Plasmodium ovale]|uniref:Uncharacterized protein n=1 Tax=Plasmodium ovale TaxID=36330 RepID=A0A1C3KEQ2_PLAOA|nr:hypothetical protein POWCR01_000019000 [Plasmodium ovale]
MKIRNILEFNISFLLSNNIKDPFVFISAKNMSSSSGLQNLEWTLNYNENILNYSMKFKEFTYSSGFSTEYAITDYSR